MTEASSGWRLRDTARKIRDGGLVAYPTEAVYGLGCDPLDPDPVLRLLELKRRSVDKGLILVAAEFDQLRPYVVELDRQRMRPVFASWPGPATWLLPARDGVPAWLTGAHRTLAVRVSAHAVVRALCSLTGPLVSTSANPSGRRPALSALAVRRYFDGALDAILAGPVDRRARPSTIRDAGSGRLLRAGG